MKERWFIATREMREVVEADNQWLAWDAWRTADRYQFGLVATAERNGDGDPYIVRTEVLMERWGRVHDAEMFRQLARDLGLEGKPTP